MKRKASTLIEVALSLPILTVMLVLAISGVQQVMRVSRLAKDRGQVAYTLSRLEQLFRSDVHRAISVDLQSSDDDGLPSLRLSLPDERQVVYRARTNRIDREQIDPDGKAHADSFALFSENKVQIFVESEKSVLMSVHRVHRDHLNAERLELFVRCRIGSEHLLGSSAGVSKDE